MQPKSLLILFVLLCSVLNIRAQVADSTAVKDSAKVKPEFIPQNFKPIEYNSPRKYKIAGISVSGVKNPMYEDYVLIGVSELSVGDVVEVPGSEITNAIKKYWKIGLFSDVKIEKAGEDGNNVWLEIKLQERPRISDIQITGLKKGERQDVERQNGLVANLQITPSQMDKTRDRIKKYLAEKGFNNATVDIRTVDDLSKENYVVLHIDILKKDKTRINTIAIDGNKEVHASTLEKAMKKTRHKSNFNAWIRNFLRSTKYSPEGYEEDKENLINKYNELGYRDAQILWDTVYAATAANKPNKVDVVLKVEEGPKYYIKDIKWVGNTKYPTSDLQRYLGLNPGDVYNQKKLMDNLLINEDAVANLFYQNNGYLFSNIDPIETNIENDSISLELRVTEGNQATIRRVGISGNDRLYEDVVRRELRIRPGALYSREDIIRSIREVAQMGHFDPEQMSNPDIQPDPESGTVDINLPLVSKANDQVEFSAGWGNTGIIGRLSLKFTNFSAKNLFYPSTYKGIIPQGDGQTLTLSAQTNARYYQSYSVSFMDPWFGGKRPNSLSAAVYYSRQTDINSNYLSNAYGGYGGYGYGYGSGYGYGYGNGYGNGYGSGYGDYSIALDPNKSFQVLGVSLGYGKRLTWPDDYFTFQAELSYQMYKMRDWAYFIVRDGTSNELSMNFTLSRRSIDNPLFTRRGSDFSLSLQITPPFSLWDGKDYKSMKRDGYYESGEKFRWIEYHKWKFKGRTFTPLIPSIDKTPVLMTRFEYGMLGYFNKDKRSPFGTFYMGGDGMSGYSDTYATETIGLRGYENGSISSNASAYTRLTLELRYPVILEPSSTIYLIGFAEAGNAWYNVGDISPFDLKRSAGVGARIILPMIGLLGIDWAYGFDKINNSRSNSGSQIHFILGQEF